MPILATGSNRRAAQPGFTLIEVLVVLAIVGMAMALMVPAINRGIGQSLDEVAGELRVGLRKARADAAARQQSVSYVVNLRDAAYQKGAGMQALPDGMTLRASVASSEVRGQQAGIRFYPDGSSTGGRIGLLEGERRVWIEVDWLTGRVSLQDE